MLSEEDERNLYLCKKERWDISESTNRFAESPYIVTLDSGREFPLLHPYAIHMALYRDAREPNERFLHMKAAHDYLWPHYAVTWNDWDEARYYAHCMHYNQIIQAGGGGCGKAQPLSALVHTPVGFRAIGSLGVGDLVTTPDGGVSPVIATTFRGVRPVYRVSFSDGTSTLCADDHLWEVYWSKKLKRRRILSTIEMLEDFKLRSYVLPDYSPVFTAPSGTLPIDPYLLGVLLGNGSFSPRLTTKLSICSKDGDVLEKCRKLSKYPFTCEEERGGCWSLLIPGLHKELRELNLQHCKSPTKFIPSQYLEASIQDRIKLLCGLIDTDGTVGAKGAISFCTSSPRLAKDVIFLVRSLGGWVRNARPRAAFAVKNGKRKRGHDKNDLSLSFGFHLPLCERKQARLAPIRRQHARRRIVSIEPEGQELCVCISLASERGLYFTNDFIVTHNSDTTARIFLQWWLASPHTRAAIIASVTLESLQTRIWGYVVRALSSAALPIGAKSLGGQSPKIIFPGVRDKIHGLFAVPVKEGSDDTSAKTLSNLVGRHPQEGLMIGFDEAPFMSAKVVDVVPNLEKGVEFFQLWAIGNSDSWNDLHGALATPAKGIDSVDPLRDDIWPTVRDNSVCLYFNPYKSPAITEPDPIKRGMLAKFLMTSEKIEREKKQYGEDSENFWRMTLGFWRPGRAGTTIVTERFLTEQAVHDVAEWSGFYALNIVAGLDSAMEVGGTGCKLRLAILGHTMEGDVCLDFKEEELLFPINIKVTNSDSGEKQLCERVLDKLIEWQCPLSNLALDATGVGRAVGGLLSVYYHKRRAVWEEPFRIISARQGSGAQKDDDPMVRIYTPTDLWTKFRDFIMRNQIRGLDRKTILQFVNRLLIRKGDKWILESKGDFRARMSARNPALAHSPDEADAAVLCCLAAQLRYGFVPGLKRELPKNADFDEFFAQKVAILSRNGLSAGDSLRAVQEEKARRGAPLIRASFGKSLEESLKMKRRED